MLRKAIKKNDNLGKKVKQHISRGRLVPDEVVVNIVQKEIFSANANRNIVLDGFPRNTNQAIDLEVSLSTLERTITKVLYFDVPFSILVDRLINRRICPKCGAVYNLKSIPPAFGSRCDRCGTSVVVRDDDEEETIRARLFVYEKETEPLKDFYRRRALLANIEVSGSSKKVWQKVRSLVESSEGESPSIKGRREE